MNAVAPACATQVTARVIENIPVADRTYRLRVVAPAIAANIQPGQFLMVRATRTLDPLLGRPFALYEVHGDTIDVVYLIMGRGTAELASRRPGDHVSVWGPLGHPFASCPGDDVIFVAGGIGQTPFLSLGKWWLGKAAYAGVTDPRPARSTRLLYGVRTKTLAAGLDDFAAAGIDVELATDDGTAGHHGFVTDLLRARLARGERPAKVIGCGPPPMLACSFKIGGRIQRSVRSFRSETTWPAASNVCFSCVAQIKQADGSIDLKRVCVEGPIFPVERDGGLVNINTFFSLISLVFGSAGSSTACLASARLWDRRGAASRCRRRCYRPVYRAEASGNTLRALRSTAM